MHLAVRPLSPTDVAGLPRRLALLPAARADVGVWLSEVQANRCVVDRTCFELLRNDEPGGYLLGLERHGLATCTGLETATGAPHAATWQLVHAFLGRLLELAVDQADFCLSPRAAAAHRLLTELGAVPRGTRTELRFGTGPRAVLSLAPSRARLEGLLAAGRGKPQA